MPYKDADKRRAYNRRYQKVYYANNAKKRKTEVALRRKNIRRWYDEIRRESNCSECGLSGETCPWLLEYHHRVAGTKTAGVSHLVSNGYSRKRIEEEMAKCDILCSNCHRIHHYEQKLVGKGPEHVGGKQTIDLDTIDDPLRVNAIKTRRKSQKKNRQKVREKRKAELKDKQNMPGPSIDES